MSCGSGLGGCFRCRVFGDRGVEHGVELGYIFYLGVALLRDDEDAWSLVEVDAFAEGLVSANLCCEEAVGVDDEGHDATMLLKILLSESVEVFLRGDRNLVCEDGAAVVFRGLGRDLILDVSGDDSGVKAPNVHLKGEVAANERDLIFFDGCVNDGEGVGAGGTLEVFKLVDSDGYAGGRTEHRGVAIVCR